MMNEIEFDEALSKYLDEARCEQMHESMFELVRSAFTSGWQAAMGSDLKGVMDICKRR